MASRALDLPASRIKVGETATTTIPNAIATAASISSDIYGAAVVVSCLSWIFTLQLIKKIWNRVDRQRSEAFWKKSQNTQEIKGTFFN